MTEEEPTHKKHTLLRILLRIFTGLVIFASVLIISVYIVFNFFGTKLLREFVRKKVYESSQGLYAIDFTGLKINIFTRNVKVSGFSLIPDTALYRKLKEQGKAKTNLYKISYQELVLHEISFRELIKNHKVQLREMFVKKPEIVLMGFPDTLASRKGRFKNVYEDVYPLASKIFKEVHIDSIYVERARITSEKEGKPGKQSVGQYEFTAVLRDVAINPYSYYNKERVFYSHDIDFIIHNISYSLSDSLYLLQAGEVGFNLVKSRIYGKNISLRPNFHSQRLIHARQGTFFQVDLPSFAIDGINLYEALTEQKVHLKKISLDLARLKIFHNSSDEAAAARKDSLHRKKRKPFNKADLFTVFSGKLKSVQLDTLQINEASLDFFRNISDMNPELRVAHMDITVEKFRLDSAAHKRKDRIFYAKNLDLNLHEIILRLRDDIHVLNAGHVYISTKRKIVDIEDAMLYPDEKKNLSRDENKKNTLMVLMPDLKFNNIDIVKAFHKQDLVFSDILVESPDVRYTKYRPSLKKKDARFRKPGDFFNEANEDVVYDLLKKYVNSIRGDSIIVNHGFMSFHQYADSADQKISSGSFDLRMFEFVIDSTHGMNQQGYFYSRDFDFNVRSFAYMSPDSLRQLNIRWLHVATKDSLIEADTISFDRTREPEGSAVRRKSSVSVAFTLDNLFLQGLNHKKLFLEKKLSANVLMLANPQVSLKAGNPLRTRQEREEDPNKSSMDFVKTLDISKLYILKGDVSFDGLERTKSSYFKLKDIDFSIQNLSMTLPERGKMNGTMRFDSISLSVKPLRMIIMDSAYELRCEDIRLNSYPLDIEVKGIDVIPLKTAGFNSPGKTQVAARIPRLRIEDFYFDRALFEKKWNVGCITLFDPMADIRVFSSNEKTKATLPLALPYNKVLGSFSVDSILIKNAGARLNFHNDKGNRNFSLEALQLTVRKFLIDSLNCKGMPGVPLFNARDIAISARGRDFILKDSLYTLGFKKVSISTGRRYLRLDSLSLMPNYPREEFYRKLGYQNDIFKVSVPKIELINIDIARLVSEKSLHVNKVALSSVKAEVYRDKRIKVLKPGKRFLFQTKIRQIPIPLTIDTLVTKEGYAVYEEQTGDEPGRIFFDRMSVLATNISNDTAVLKKNRVLSISGSARLMGKGRMTGQFRLDMINPRDSMWWSGTVDSVDLKEINPMVSKLLPAKISHGFVNKARIGPVKANDVSASGSLELHYSDLYLELNLVNTGSFQKLKNELITTIANAILPDENPDYRGRLKAGIIYFNRDTTKGFFNFVWKSTLSGLKSTMGINSPQQKQIKKDLKRKAK